MEASDTQLNELWERRIKDAGADFVYYVDITTLPDSMTGGLQCAVLFGKALSKDYINAVRDDRETQTREMFNTERKMDTLAEKLAVQLEAEGYKSVAKLKTGLLPHKTVALRAGLGFIGKNNLLVTPQYGCALILGKVLTSAPFASSGTLPEKPQCGNCNICVNACPTGALLGKEWNINTAREEILTRKLCILCLKCMVSCPYTVNYSIHK